MPETALHRQQVLEAVARAQAEGNSQNAACRILGVSSANITRWRSRYAAEGLAGLEPARDKSGRKPLVTLTEDERHAVQHLKVKLESTTQALRMFADSPECRAEVAEAIRKPRSSKHTLTRTLRDQAAVPAQVVNFYKSPKNVRVNCFINPRTLQYIDALGTTQALRPGDLFERDDMSNNFIVHVPWPWGGDPCSDKYGVRVARGQCLEMIDVASLFFTSFNFLIRLRDSYRADDIWQWVHQTYRANGLPRIGERWERGTWASRRLRGDQEAMIEAGHTPESARLGGMAALGLRVIESQSPTTKIIENRFNFLQKIEATIPGQIGRQRGEFERVTKTWMACRAGHQDPREHFPSYEEACDRIEQAHAYVNAEKVEGYIYDGVPAARWQEGMAEAPLAPMPEEKGYLFARARREITAAKAHVMVRFTRDDKTRGAWWFHHENLWRHEGEKIAVFFDDYAPGEGATLQVLTGRAAGTVLAGAECIEGAPQFALAGSSIVTDGGGLSRRKAFMDAVISETRTLGLTGRASRCSTADNGEGGRTTLSQTARGHGAQGDPATAPARGLVAHETPGRSVTPYDEDAELARLERMERAAFERGDLLPV